VRDRSVQQRCRHDDRIDAPRATGRRSRQGSAAGKADAHRPEYSHVTLHRAARWRRGNEPHCRWPYRSRALYAGFRVGLPAPAKDSACPDKPRNPDERFSAHGDVLPARLSGRRTVAGGLFPSDHQERDDHHA